MSAQVRQLVTLNGVAYFVAGDAHFGEELWRSDGTAAGTSIVADIIPGPGSPIIEGLTAHAGKLYFSAHDGVTGQELWVSDGTASGTRLLRDIFPGGSGAVMPSGNPGCGESIAAAGNVVYFVASDTVFSRTQLWRTDGSPAGTQKVADLRGNGAINGLCQLFAHNGLVYFSFGDLSTGIEVYRSDGTASGTFRLRDIAPGAESSMPGQFTAFRDRVYFIAHPSGTSLAPQLWRTDGTVAGTEKVHDDAGGLVSLRGVGTLVGVVGDRLILTLGFGSQTALYSTDGTAAGTASLTTSLQPVGAGVLSGGQLFYACADLCVTDGTPSGTQKVKSSLLGSGTQNSAKNLLDVNGTLYFQAHDATLGTVIWKSNGTASSTVRVPGGPVAAFDRMAIGGAYPVFGGFDFENGIELWRSFSAAPRANDDTATTTSGAAVNIGITANDTDTDSSLNLRSVRVSVQPANGSVSVSSDGSARYLPNSGFAGADSFRYRIADEFGILSNEASVSVTVSAAPPPPLAGGSSGSGGGGAIGLWSFVFLLASALRTRYRRLATIGA